MKKLIFATCILSINALANNIVNANTTDINQNHTVNNPSSINIMGNGAKLKYIGLQLQSLKNNYAKKQNELSTLDKNYQLSINNLNQKYQNEKTKRQNELQVIQNNISQTELQYSTLSSNIMQMQNNKEQMRVNNINNKVSQAQEKAEFQALYAQYDGILNIIYPGILKLATREKLKHDLKVQYNNIKNTNGHQHAIAQIRQSIVTIKQQYNLK